MGAETSRSRLLRQKQAQFTQLSHRLQADQRRCATGVEFTKRFRAHYNARFQEILGKNNSPEDLAQLALWGYRQPDWWGDGIYDVLFFNNVAMLGQTKGERAKRELQRIKAVVKRDGRWDAHLSESITEAEEMQKELK